MKNFLILFMLLSASIGNAQQLSKAQQIKVNEALKSGKTVYFKFRVSSIQEIGPLAKIITVERNQGSEVYAHANKAQFSQFIVKGYPYTIIKNTKPATKVKPKTATKSKK
jgi:hypothetical protein